MLEQIYYATFSKVGTTNLDLKIVGTYKPNILKNKIEYSFCNPLTF